MGSDASIYSLIRPMQVTDPLEQYGKMMSIKSLMGGEQLNALQREHLQRTLDEGKALQSYMANAQPGAMEAPDFFKGAIGAGANPEHVVKLQQNALTQRKTQAELGKIDLEVQAAKAKDARDTLAGVTDQASYDAWRKYGTDKQYQVAAQAPATFDPAWQKQHLMTADKFIETAQQDRTFTETQRHNKVTELHAALTQKETARHHAALEGDPQTIEDTAQAIAAGRLAPLSGFALSRPMAQNIMSRVAQINPEFDPTQFQTRQKAEKDFATGKQGNSVRSFNVALSHLDTLDSLAGALHNGNIKLINEIGNRFATQTGSEAPTNFVAAKKIVSDEIVKAIVGSGGGVTDREEAAKTIAAANSPAQLKGVINTYKELMRGQLNGLRDQYKATTGKDDFDTKYLSESGRQVAHGKPAPAAKGGIKFLGFE